jgi:hypothetical protein
METRKEDGLWKWVNENVTRILEDLKKDSVANNPRKPVDCCNPPTLTRSRRKLKIRE